MSNAHGQGFLITAPHSGSGKTTITLGLLRALKNRGVALGPCKAGPDFIDPSFHAFASGETCVNLDPWAMRDQTIFHLASEQSKQGMLVVEAMMGLFDGAADGTGSAADLAERLKLPIILVVDASRQSHSIAALVHGFSSIRKNINIAGVILNRVGSDRHEKMLRSALSEIEIPVFGCVRRDEKLALPSRHLGLVQAREHGDIEAIVDYAGQVCEQSIDVDALCALKNVVIPNVESAKIPVPGQRIAIARDDAFAFIYEHLLRNWRGQGAEISFFSPLADEAPLTDCDSVYLPGGYPELFAGQLAQSIGFLSGLRKAAQNEKLIYGECGGYMVLGEGLVDAEGTRHTMAELLPLVTSFEKRKRQLGYRVVKTRSVLPMFGEAGTMLAAHEFHYSTVIEQGNSESLFDVEDALGENLGQAGQRIGQVMGSYIHLIDGR